MKEREAWEVFLLDPDLPAAERARLTARLKADPEAQARYAALEAVWRLLDHYPGVQPSRDLSLSLVAAARETLRRERRGRVLRFVAGVAAAAAIILGVCLVLPESRPRATRAAAPWVEEASAYWVARYDFEDF